MLDKQRRAVRSSASCTVREILCRKMGLLRRVTGGKEKFCVSYRNSFRSFAAYSNNGCPLLCDDGNYSLHSHINEGHHTRLYETVRVRLRRRHHWSRFRFIALIFTPAVLCAPPSVVGHVDVGAFENEPLETAISSSDSEGEDSPGRLPRLVRNTGSIFVHKWVPLKASAWLFPNSSEVAPTDTRLASKGALANLLDYTEIPLPLITDEVAAVRLTAREVMIKGLILKTADEDWRKAACLAVGMENLEIRHHDNGEPEPPVLPLDWEQTQKILLKAAGARCRLYRHMAKVKKRCTACFSEMHDDLPDSSLPYENSIPPHGRLGA